VNRKVYNVLFLCTGNSARSILAQVLLNQLGKGQFNAYSAGSFPKGAVHPLAIELLERLGLPRTGLRSKSWKEFARPGAPIMADRVKTPTAARTTAVQTRLDVLSEF
jgi:arsenate reductase